MADYKVLIREPPSACSSRRDPSSGASRHLLPQGEKGIRVGRGRLFMFTFFYAPGTCALASHIALEDAGASYELKRARFPQDRAAIAGLSRDQSQGPRAHAENPARRSDGDAGDPRLYRAEFSRGPPRAVGRPFRLRAIAGVHQLSLLDRACRARPWTPGLSVGGRGGFVRRHETQGSSRASAPVSN